MDRRERVLRIAAVIVWVLFVLGLGTPTQKARAEVKLRLGHPMSSEWTGNPILVKMAKNIGSRTNGRVIAEIFPGGQLGSPTTLMERVNTGEVDMNFLGLAHAGKFRKDLGTLASGFLFKDGATAMKFLRGPTGKQLVESFIKSHGIRIIDYSLTPPRHLTTRDRPVWVPEDVKDMIIRGVEAEVYLETLKSFAPKVAAVPFTELFMALQTRVVDGQENPLGHIYDQKFYEVQHYLALTAHMEEPWILPVNEKKFQKISPKDQQVVIDEGRKACDEVTKQLYAIDEGLLQKLMDKGMKVTLPNKKAFRETALPKMTEFFKKNLGEEMFSAIQKMQQ